MWRLVGGSPRGAALGAAAAALLLAGCETRVVRESGYGPPSAFPRKPQWDEPPKKKANAPAPSFPNPLTMIGDGFAALLRPFAPKPKPAQQTVTASPGQPVAAPTNFNGEGVLQAADGAQYKVRFQDGKVISSEPRLGSPPKAGQ